MIHTEPLHISYSVHYAVSQVSCATYHWRFLVARRGQRPGLTDSGVCHFSVTRLGACPGFSSLFLGYFGTASSGP